MLNFKKNWDLIGLFIMLCFIVLYLAGDLIIHARTELVINCSQGDDI